MTAPNPPVSSIVPSWGGPLTNADYAALERSWISPELADQALLARVNSADGATILGRRDNGSYDGIVFSYVWPGEDYVREYWLRRDRPEIEHNSEGHPKEKNKYLGPPGRGNLLYITPGTQPDLLNDVRVPVAITEGAKKTIALHRLSTVGIADGALPRFLAIGLGGVWSFKGTIGKATGPDGSRRDEKGVISDFRRLEWTGRRAYVVFDANVNANPKVAAARRQLTAELIRLGAEVYWVNLPQSDQAIGVNGVDDLRCGGPSGSCGSWTAANLRRRAKVNPARRRNSFDCAEMWSFSAPRKVRRTHTSPLVTTVRRGCSEAKVSRDGFPDSFISPPGNRRAPSLCKKRSRFSRRERSSSRL
jgi:hypothetical protein